MKLIQYSFFILLFLYLTGCNATREVKENSTIDNAPSIENNLTIVQKAKKPILPRITYKGPAFRLGAAIGGILGAAIADGSTSTKDVLENYMSENDILIDEMIFTSLNKELAEVSLPIELTELESPNKMIIEVKEYGFEKGWGFSKVKPMVSLRTKIIDKDGNELIHRIRKVGGATSSTPSNKLDFWVSDPNIMRDGFQSAIDIVVKQTVEAIESYEF